MDGVLVVSSEVKILHIRGVSHVDSLLTCSFVMKMI